MIRSFREIYVSFWMDEFVQLNPGIMFLSRLELHLSLEEFIFLLSIFLKYNTNVIGLKLTIIKNNKFIFKQKSGPFLAENVSIAIPIVGFTVYVLTIIHFLACFFIDPGYLPRASAYEAFVIEKENNILTDLSGAYYPPPRNKIVKVNGFDYEMRFCVSLNHLLTLLISITINVLSVI